MIYLAVGMLVGPLGIKLLDPGLREDGRLIGTISETAVLICLFCVGLRLRAPLDWRFWRTPLRLGTLTMLATVALIAGAAHTFFDLTFAEALLLGAILAPTDPVLVSSLPLLPASEEQEDSRFVLAAEGAINSGLALPILVFALGAVGLNDGSPGLAWFSVELLWDLGGGAVLGWLLGAAAVRGLTRLDTERQADLLEELLVLVAGALAYGGARALGANGFVAVLAAGLALSHGGRLKPAVAIRKLKPRLLAISMRVERLASAVIVLLLGAMVALVEPRAEMFVFALLILIAVRPIAVYLGLGRASATAQQERRLLGWFGVRGAASLFYLITAINYGLPAETAHELTAITLVTLVTSIVLHGLSATPLVSRPVDRLG